MHNNQKRDIAELFLAWYCSAEFAKIGAVRQKNRHHADGALEILAVLGIRPDEVEKWIEEVKAAREGK